MTTKIMNIIKHRLFKITSTIVVVMVLGWGISSFAEDDIKSATLNFSVMGTVSEVSDKYLKLTDAKGSNNSGVTSYDLNISYLEKIETSKKDSIVLSDIKAGDRIIAQGLTNGSTFFIKRIISFSSVAIEQEKQNATSTEVVADTATTTNAVATDFSSSTNSVTSGGTSENPAENDKSQDNKVADVPTGDSSSTTTDEVSTTTSTTTGEASTTTDDSATTTSVVETVVDVVEAVVDTIKDIINNVLDTFTGDNSTSTDTVVDVNINTENTNSSNQNVTESSPEQVTDTSSDVNISTE